MERKNTMLLTVIAVATLLVAVVGATFAYYSVQSGVNNSTTAINTTTGKAATVTYTSNTTQLYLNVTAAQMAPANVNTVYYAQTSNTDAVASATTIDYEFGKFEVTGAGASDIHECTFDWSLTTSGTLKNLADNTTNGRITISLGSSDTGEITSTTGTLVGTHAFSTTAASGTAKFRATGDKVSTIRGTASITNTNSAQNTPSTNDISNLSDVVTTFQVTNVVCNAVAS